MCGIVGFTGNKNEPLMAELLTAVAHRGPDEQAARWVDGMHLGMARLAIRDLSRGIYPLRWKHYSLVFNGELYNETELKRRLNRYDYRCRTTCDAEVILPLFDKLGPDTFALLEGMFAIAIYDERRKEIWLARDKMGEKPLYYYQEGQDFCFGSEMKTVIGYMKWRGQTPTVNHARLPAWFTQGFVVGPDTLVNRIRKVPPATWIRYSTASQAILSGNYWTADSDWNALDKATDTENYLDRLLESSVRDRLVSDVPVGVFISGGVDSGLIGYYAAAQVPRLKTFSVVFRDGGHCDESAYSRQMATFLGSDHTEIEVSPDMLAETIDGIGKTIDEPIIDAAVLPTKILAATAAKQVGVTLTGEGADEVFGGYHHYQRELLGATLHQWADRIPGLKHMRNRYFPGRLEKIFTPAQDHYGSQNIWRRPQLERLLRKQLDSNPAFVSNSQPDDLLLWMQLTDAGGYLPEQLCMKVDKMTMAHSLEARAPFLAPKMVQLGLHLPASARLRGIHGKYVLKRVAGRHLPHHLVWRIKHGFSVPLGDWFRRELKPYVLEAAEQTQAWQEWFDCGYYRELVDTHLDGTVTEADKLWSVMLLSRWMSAYGIKP